MPCHKLLVLVPLIAGLASCGGGEGGSGPMPGPPPPPPPPPPLWHTPTCDEVKGEPIATFSLDAGVTLQPLEHSLPVSMFSQTGWLAAASDVAVLYASHGRGVYISRDAGCSWTLAHLAGPDDDTDTFRAVVASDRMGYVQPSVNRDRLFVFDPDGLVAVRDLPANSVTFATTPSDRGAVYLVAQGGPSATAPTRLFRSADEGVSWVEIGSEATSPVLIKELAINPNDSLHMVAARNRNPAVSFDGGISWTEAEGVGGTLEVVFGGDGIETDIWVRGVRTPDGGGVEMFIAHSSDGGLTFNDVVVQNAGISMAKRTLATRPGVAGELFFGGTICGPGGNVPTFYHYRASDDSVTVLDHRGFPHAFHRLVFNPVDPDVLYLGLDGTVRCPQ